MVVLVAYQRGVVETDVDVEGTVNKHEVNAEGGGACRGGHLEERQGVEACHLGMENGELKIENYGA